MDLTLEENSLHDEEGMPIYLSLHLEPLHDNEGAQMISSHITRASVSD